MRVLFRRLVAFVAAVLNFLRHKIHLQRQPEPDPEPDSKDPDEEAMIAEKMRDAWHNAQLGEILVESNAAVVVRTLTGVIEIPKVQEPQIKAQHGKWLLGNNNDLRAAIAPRKKDS